MVSSCEIQLAVGEQVGRLYAHISRDIHPRPHALSYSYYLDFAILRLDMVTG